MASARRTFTFVGLAVACALWIGVPASGSVTEDEAAKLKTTLTPLGAERAGSSDGLIPAWTGGITTVPPSSRPGDPPADPFPNEKPILTITAQNAAQYADRLTDGTVALLKRFPDYRVNVYPTHRTEAAPQHVYDSTYQNALHGKLNGNNAENVSGGIPFPIPKSGAEVMWNHSLRWRGESFDYRARTVFITPDGKQVLVADESAANQMPYYFADGSGKGSGDYWLLRIEDHGPPIKAGSAFDVHYNVNDDKSQIWVYVPGQRRVRRVPNPCCDTPAIGSGGIITIDEVEVWNGPIGRYDWKIVGKKEMYIPYNENRAMRAPENELLGPHFLNPDLVRWELHRVWVIDATLRSGQRHQVPHARFYVDEDSWLAVLADRYDAQNQLWKISWLLPVAWPEFPGVVDGNWGLYNLQTGDYSAWQNFAPGGAFRKVPRYSSTFFSPETMGVEGQ